MKNNKSILYIFVFILTVTSIITCCVPNARKYVNAFIYKDLAMDTVNIPAKNKLIIKYAEAHGKEISPTYKTAVCTEYVIKILSNFTSLNNKQKSDIRIITDKKIEDLLNANSPVTKGVYTSLTNSKIGIPIDKIEDVKAGDFVQFWNNFRGEFVGHCGIVRAIDTKKGIISMYSSSPKTNGHGKQTYIIPAYIYFVRLK